MLSPEPRLSREHLELRFDGLSRTYEIVVLGRTGAMVDGFEYGQGAVVRLGSGSCVRVDGDVEICVLLPQTMRHEPVPPLPLPELPGAGGDEPPALPPELLAAYAIRTSERKCLTVGEVEGWVRRCWPHTIQAVSSVLERREWRDALHRAMVARPDAFRCRERAQGEPGAGAVWELKVGAA